jgi:hypothetical protein
MGEVHHHVAPGQRVARVTLIDPGANFHIARGRDRLAYLRAHAPTGAEHTYFDHDCLPFLPERAGAGRTSA